MSHHSSSWRGGPKAPTGNYPKPDKSFFKYFRGPKLWASKGLWLAYQQWRAREQERDYARFAEIFEKNREMAKKQVDEWPNPFINGKKGKKYDCSFQLPDRVRTYLFHGLDKIGLAAARDKTGNCVITGTPIQAGEFTITLLYGFDGYNKSLPPLRRDFIISINPDPKELWQDIPTDPNLEYFKEDTDAALLACGRCKLAGASRRGRSHAHAGLPRDDDFALDCVNGWSILAVADGAGSARFSRRGSALAVLRATEICRNQLAGPNDLDALCTAITKDMQPAAWLPEARKLAYGILPNAFFEACKAIRAEAVQHGREAREYATTLLMALCKEFKAGWIVLSFQIGDGAMAMFHDGGLPELLAEPDEGEYGGQTRFITMKEIFEAQELMRRLRVNLVPRLDAILLMTDGISDARFATLANLRNPEFWTDLWNELAPRLDSAPASLLEWLLFWSQGNHDDRTLALMRA